MIREKLKQQPWEMNASRQDLMEIKQQYRRNPEISFFMSDSMVDFAEERILDEEGNSRINTWNILFWISVLKEAVKLILYIIDEVRKRVKEKNEGNNSGVQGLPELPFPKKQK